jgi:hypothetical protein
MGRGFWVIGWSDVITDWASRRTASESGGTRYSSVWISSFLARVVSSEVCRLPLPEGRPFVWRPVIAVNDAKRGVQSALNSGVVGIAANLPDWAYDAKVQLIASCR